MSQEQTIASTTTAVNPPLDTPVNNGFDVLFAGLICFAREPDRVALFANGVQPADPNVVPHFPYLIVEPFRINTESGWGTQTYGSKGIYLLPRCRVEISGATTAGHLDPKPHDENTPRLFEVDPTIKIDPATADAIVRVNPRNGVLEALRHPDKNRDDPDNVGIISRLRVENYSTPITIDVWEGTTRTRTMTLRPNTDIALANIGFPLMAGKTGNHFSIYGALTKGGTIKDHPKKSPNVTVIRRQYYVFTLPLPIADGTAMCGTSGCCPPP
ncbi:MAG TPA: hypothetical protein VGQ65_13585 [Thermoanaerobaculia bacterium]|jgi:hypothetical protein|nr:hypothetical protein [Thermoanaerobaculia bacterium]